ncbi:MAG: PDZ domain-containing protein [Verrucomicrobiota bacterium]|nr:PDZ domain-containing protein [Verrucomicrobiota bacterium]
MKQLFATFSIFVALAASTVAAEKAWYGFHIKPKTSGFPLNPIVDSVTIDMIAPNSPASTHGIQVGDEIIEAEGTKIAGTRGLALISLVKKQPGETLRLVLRHNGGETYRVSIVGIKKPGT